MSAKLDVSPSPEAARQVRAWLLHAAAIVESSEDAIIGRDLAGRVMSWNRGAEKLFGYSSEEMLGQTLERLIPTDAQLREVQIDHQVSSGESVRHFEAQRVTKTGSAIDISVTVSPLRGSGGEVVGTSKVARDITEQRRAKAELEASFAENVDLKHALDQHAIVAITDPRGKITFVNDAFCAISRYEREQLIGQDHRLINSGYHPPDFFRDLWKTIRGGQVWRGEIQNRAKDGALYWVATTIVPFFDRNGKLRQYVAIRADITERKRVEAELRQSEARFRAVAESLPQLVWTSRGDGSCDYLSPQWLAYTGTPERDNLGLGWLNQLHPDDRQRTQTAWRAVAARGDSFDAEFRIRRHDGTYRWFKTRSAPIRDAGGSIVKWFGSNTDIQDLRDAQENLSRANQELEARVEARTRETTAVRDALASVAAQLQAAQRIAQLGSWELDVATGKVVWSEELYRILGLDPQGPQPSPEHRARLFSPKSAQAIHAAIDRAVSTGAGYELEIEILRADGSRRWAITRAEAVRDAGQHVSKLIGTLQDVTELKRIQLELERASERVRVATDAASMGIWDWNVESDVLVWDETMYRLYGLAAQDFCGAYEAWRGAVHPDDLAGAEAALRAATQGPGDFDAVFRIVRAGGEIRHLKATAVAHRDLSGRAVRLVGINLDITAQRNAELASRANETLLREFVRHAPAAIAMLDRQMRYLQTSDRWLTDYKLGNRDIVGLSHYEVFPDLPTNWRLVHERVLAGAIESADDAPFQREDGSTEWLQWEARPWHQGDGTIGGLIFFTQVTTARKQMELLLQRQKNELERSNQELEQFAYIASHDLQEPLRAVAGCGQLLLQEYQGKLDAGADELIRHMVEGGSRMQGLVLDLLAYSRLRTHGEPFSVIDSNESFRRALTQLHAAIAETGAQIEAQPLPPVLADPVQLTQLFQNLLGNALKYRGQAPPLIRVSAAYEDTSWHFSVADNGIGIEPQYFERIFVIFQRLHTRLQYPGTGIGLAICQKIVERHGGRIWLESALGHGSTFHFTLPALRASA